MWRKYLLTALMFAAAAPPAAGQEVSSEHAFRPGTIAFTISAGGAAFTDFQRVNEQPDTAAASFGRRLAPGTTGAIGADLSWWLRPTLGVRVHGSYMPSRFTVQHDRAGEAWLRSRNVSAQAPSYGGLSIWVADVSLVARPPLTLGRVAPYGIAGAGIVSYRPQSRRSLPPEAEAAFGGGARTEPAAVLGVGALVPLQAEHMLLSFAITDHITRTPVSEPARVAVFRDLQNGSLLRPESPPVRLTSNVRLMVGLTITLRSRP